MSRSRALIAWFAFAVFISLIFSPDKLVAQSTEDAPYIERLDPPQFGFFAKSVDCGGVFIRGSAEVQDDSLLRSCAKITTMLAQMEVAKQNLRQRGVELHIVSRDQKLSQLPENHDEKSASKPSADKTDVNALRETVGIYSACGEESLPAAPVDGSSILDLCTRAFAIALMNYGFDEEIRRLIETQYRSSVSAGKWTATRAAASPEDYWAELSVQYFATRQGFGNAPKGEVLQANRLQQRDPAGFSLLELLYSGKKRPIRIEAIRARRVSKLALSGVNSHSAELQLVNNSAQTLRIFWIDTEGEIKSLGELEPYNRMIEKTFFSHVWMIEDERGVELQRFVVEDYLSEVIAAD